MQKYGILLIGIFEECNLIGIEKWRSEYRSLEAWIGDLWAGYI